MARSRFGDELYRCMGALRQPRIRLPARALHAWRKFRARFGRHAREAAWCCVRRSWGDQTRARSARRFEQAAGASAVASAMVDRSRASYGSQNPHARTRSIHAGGNSARASGATPAKRRAACRRRSCAAGRGRVPRRSGQAAGAARCQQPPRRWAESTKGAMAARTRRASARSTPEEILRALRRHAKQGT